MFAGLSFRGAARASVLGALLAVGIGMPAAAVDVTGDAVLYWNQVAVANGFPGSPTVGSRSYAILGAAIHDAANATLGSPDHSYSGVAGSGGNTRAAVSQAAHDVLVTLNPAKTAQYDAALTASLALVSDGASKTSGRATGSAVAGGIISLRANDGSTAVVSYSPTGEIGHWAPTAPGQVAALPQWGQVDPWILNSGDQLRPAGPPALTSDAYAAAFNEVLSLGSLTSATRSADQTAAAQFWNLANGTAPWISGGVQAAEAQGLTTLQNAQLFGLLSLSVADAVIATWDAKYTYDFWRPVTAIRLAEFDGNAMTTADPAWTSLIGAPGHPSYVSAHSAVAGAAVTVLNSFLDDNTGFCLTTAFQRCWGSFDAAAEDAANSRLWGGIHFGFDNAQGLALGRQAGAFALASQTFDAVPEPSAWALMIIGFGAAGAALRRRREPA